jgi:hypothetical protein
MQSVDSYKSISSIPHLFLLQSRITLVAEKENKSAQAVDIALELLPHSLSEAAWALLSVGNSMIEAINSVKRRCTPKVNTVSIESMTRDEQNPIAFFIDSYFDAGRRAQNSVSAYLSKILRISLSMSLSEISKNLKDGKIDLPQRISELIANYWTHSGQRLKDYRDLAQHHAVVSSDGRVTIAPNGQMYFYVVLPNNPEIVNPGLLQYTNPRIDALPFIYQSYIDLYNFIFELTHVLLSYTTIPATEVMSLMFKGPVRLGRSAIIDGHPFLDLSDIVTGITDIQNELKLRLEAELPRKNIIPTLIVPNLNASA